MALTEQQRSEIYGNLVKTTGQQAAEFLMAQQPPGGWEQLATKQDLSAADAKMNVGFAGVEVKIGELNSQIKDTNAEIKGVRAEVATGFAEVATGFAEVATGFARLTARRGRDVWAFAAAIAAITAAVCGSVFVSFWQFAPA